MASITAQRAALTAERVKWLEEIFNNAGVEYFRTGNNLATMTFECGEIEGKPVYGSIKFTLHKADYNLDDEIEEFEMLLEEKEKKAEEKRRRDAKALKDKAAREAKAAEKKALEEKERERRREYLASLEEKRKESGQYTRSFFIPTN